MHDRQISDDEEDEVRFNRFQSEREQNKERSYHRQQREEKQQRLDDWLKESVAGEEAEAEEEVQAEPVVKAKRPIMFSHPTLDGFKAPRVPRHKALTGRNSPPRPPRQVPSFHHRGEKSLQLTNM